MSRDANGVWFCPKDGCDLSGPGLACVVCDCFAQPYADLVAGGDE